MVIPYDINWFWPIAIIAISVIFYFVFTYSYRHYREWFRLSPVGSVILDEDDKILECNDAFASLSGYSIQQLKGKPLSPLLSNTRENSNDWMHIHRSLPVANRQNENMMFLTSANGEQKIVSVHQHNVRMTHKQLRFITIHDITEQQKEARKMTHLAYHDHLTGLANRQRFQETFQQLLSASERSELSIACMLIDIDDFKQVNDTMGHLAGDNVLKIIANRLSNCVREEDLVVRIGGDEFVILLPFTNKAFLLDIAKRMIKQLNDPIVIDGVEWKISPSIGISLYPEDGQDVDTLLNRADQAMYVAKKKGKNNYCLFAPVQ